MTGRLHGEEGAIPFVVVGVATLGGVLGLAWAGQEWAESLLREAGGELTVWVLRGAFWALDLVALQSTATPVTRDWYTPVLEGPALPIYALAALVTVATLIAEVIAGMATGNTTRIVQAIFRALVAGMLASAGGALLLAIGGALSDLGRIALEASGTSVDAPLVPLQEVLMESPHWSCWTTANTWWRCVPSWSASCLRRARNSSCWPRAACRWPSRVRRRSGCAAAGARS